VTGPSPEQSPVLPIRTGEIIGERYLVGEVLGCGGMGIICAGTHLLLGTPVAIKLIHSELKNDTEALQRFVNEARAAAVLKGEHIARVFDAGVLDSGEPYLVMEQLEGLSLDQYLEGRGQLSEGEAVDILLQVCEGLAEAHAAGLVHRDIKPANLFSALRPDGHSSIKILDFGIVKWVHAASVRLTDPGKSLGSPWYMSPEQMSTPADVDARSDVWSLGVLLFELLTRRLPFAGETVPEVCASVLTSDAPSLRRYRPEVAPELDAIVQRCLEKDRERRIRSANELAHALLPFASHAAAYPLDEPKDLTAARTAAHRVRRRRRSWPFVLVLVASGLVTCAAWLQSRDPSLAVHAARAAFGSTARPGSDSAFAAPPPELPDTVMLQYIHMAHARPERQRWGEAPVEPLTRVRVEPRPVEPPPVEPQVSEPRVSESRIAEPRVAQPPVVEPPVVPPVAPRESQAAKHRREAEELYGL
jgi:serine/threonine-protein kinase